MYRERGAAAKGPHLALNHVRPQRVAVWLGALQGSSQLEILLTSYFKGRVLEGEGLEVPDRYPAGWERAFCTLCRH